MLKLLLLEDDFLERRRYERHFDLHQGQVEYQSASHGEQLLQLIQVIPNIDIFILDFYLSSQENKTSQQYISVIQKKFPQATIIMCSQLNTVDIVFQCIQEGADEFLCKKDLNLNLFFEKMKIIHEKVLKKKGIGCESKNQTSFFSGETLSLISHRIPQILKSAVRVVSLEGESGTGKEVVAEIFQNYAESENKRTPFYKLNCATIPLNLMESELFGHKKGSFTSSISDKKGVFELAHGGWLFLDEISSLSLPAQAAILRAIENQEIISVGDVTTKKIDVKIICASNVSLKEMVDQQLFRKDLWQRLQECEIHLPPLRDRQQEIPELVQYFSRQMEGGPYFVDDTAIQILMSCRWENGNIRELRNCLRAMTENHCEKILSPFSIPKRLWKKKQTQKNKEANIFENLELERKKTEKIDLEISENFHHQYQFLYQENGQFKPWEEIERSLFHRIYENSKKIGKSHSEVAKELNISRNTLSKKIHLSDSSL